MADRHVAVEKKQNLFDKMNKKMEDAEASVLTFCGNFAMFTESITGPKPEKKEKGPIANSLPGFQGMVIDRSDRILDAISAANARLNEIFRDEPKPPSKKKAAKKKK